MAGRPKGNYISYVKQASSITFFIDDIKITLTDTIIYQKERNNQYKNLQKLFSSLQLLLPFHLLTNDKYGLHLCFLFLFDLHSSVLQVLVTMVMASHTEVMQPKHFRVSRGQSWSSQCPHRHYRTPNNFPELENAGNACRNPGGQAPHGPWCYTINRKVRWEYCYIEKCEGRIKS